MKTLDIIDAEVIEDDTEELIFDAPVTARQQKINELRWVLSVMEREPEAIMPYSMSNVVWYPNDATEAAKIAKALGGKWDKNDPNASDYDAQYMVLSRKVDLELRLEIIVSRGLVCERTVVGTKRVKKAVVIQPQITEDQYVVVEDVEFSCGSILSAAAKLEMDKLEALTVGSTPEGQKDA